MLRTSISGCLSDCDTPTASSVSLEASRLLSLHQLVCRRHTKRHHAQQHAPPAPHCASRTRHTAKSQCFPTPNTVHSTKHRHSAIHTCIVTLHEPPRNTFVSRHRHLSVHPPRQHLPTIIEFVLHQHDTHALVFCLSPVGITTNSEHSAGRNLVGVEESLIEEQLFLR